MLVSKKTNFNKYAKRIIPIIKERKVPMELINVISSYENVIGADRGYEFFSPNIASKDGILLFTNERGEQLYLLNSIEGYIKYYTFNSYLMTFMSSEDHKNTIFKNISSYLFEKYPDSKEINITLNSRNIKNNEKNEIVKNEKLLLTNVKKIK